MNPIMFRGDEYKGHYQEVLREVMENEQFPGQNSIIRVWSGLGGIIIGLVVAGLWLG